LHLRVGAGDTARGEINIAYDEGLAERIFDALRDRPNASEKKMFGGAAFVATLPPK
jgi:hypothetical protein